MPGRLATAASTWNRCRRSEPLKEPEITLPKEKKTIATISLAGCFGCHMSLLDIDLKLLDLVEVVDLNKSPLNDIKEFTKQLRHRPDRGRVLQCR